jgi:NAD(P)-dependent dehydrogenase (short-subunit alcohol dehydrogenase family)
MAHATLEPFEPDEEPGGQQMDAHNKICFVAGAASGLGRLAAQRWSRAGGVVAAADVNEDGLRETAADCDSIRTWHLDVTNRLEVDSVVKAAESELGPIERVYNSAAIQPTSLLLEQDPEEIHRVMNINYGGLVNVSLSTLPRLLERGRGALINFASIAGWVPTMHFGAYNASKFACVAFTEVLYHENRGKGVHISCVCPPKVDTPLVAQATSKPKILETGPPAMEPGVVLDAIDRAVDRGKFWVFPGMPAQAGWRLRRFLPSLMWKIDHDAEGF